MDDRDPRGVEADLEAAIAEELERELREALAEAEAGEPWLDAWDLS